MKKAIKKNKNFIFLSKKNKFHFLIFGILFFSLITNTIYSQTVKTVGTTQSNYLTLKAAFDAINNGTLTGDIALQIKSI